MGLASAEYVYHRFSVGVSILDGIGYQIDEHPFELVRVASNDGQFIYKQFGFRFSALLKGNDENCPCCRRRFDDAS